jgi:hypothetical protein
MEKILSRFPFVKQQKAVKESMMDRYFGGVNITARPPPGEETESCCDAAFPPL